MSEPFDKAFDKAIILDLFRQIAEHLEMTQKSFEAVSDVTFFPNIAHGQGKTCVDLYVSHG